MKNIVVLGLAVVVCGLMSCAGSKGSDEKVAILSIQQTVTDVMPLSQVFADIRYVPLETKDSLLIDRITKVIHRDSYVYVADRANVYRFSMTGVLSGQINKQGQGPDEYVSVTDFEVAEDGSIWILNRNNKRLLHYSWENELLETVDMTFWPKNIYLYDCDRMFVYIGNEIDEGNTDQLKLIDLKTKTVEQGFLPIDEKKAKYLHVSTANHFSQSHDGKKLYFFDVFTDSIYDLSGKGIHPMAQLDLNGKNIPPSFFDGSYDNIAVFFQSLFQYDYAYAGGFFLDNRNTYLLSYLYQKKQCFAVVDKATNRSVLEFRQLRDDVNLAGYPINLTGQQIFIQRDHTLALPLIPGDIIDYAEANLDAGAIQQVKEAIQYAGEDQNPVILIMAMGDR